MSDTTTVSPLRQRMIEDMAARKLNPHTQRSHISSCKRFAVWLKRSPDTATPDEVRRFQLHLIESGASICNRNRIMTGVRVLFRVTLRRHDLAAEGGFTGSGLLLANGQRMPCRLGGSWRYDPYGKVLTVDALIDGMPAPREQLRIVGGWNGQYQMMSAAGYPVDAVRIA